MQLTPGARLGPFEIVSLLGAQLLASLNHPNIADIHGIEDGQVGPAEAGHHVRALVLELVEGPTLADRLVDGPIPLAEALPMARQIVDAVDAAHQQGVILRDLKPGSRFLAAKGRPCLLQAARSLGGVPMAGRSSTSRRMAR
jgi:serine/threonine-protein kinase